MSADLFLHDPIKLGGAEIDHRGIQAQQRILETELPLLLGFWLAGPNICTSPATAQTPRDATAKADAHWRRPGWSKKESLFRILVKFR
jgi:hypothetical protein